MGRALRTWCRANEVVLATKVHGAMRKDANGRGLSRKAIFAEIDASLRRLGTDYVDLYQIHRFDHDTPIEETLEALHDVVQAGKARYIGASSMHAWQFCKALYLAERTAGRASSRCRTIYNLLYREEEREMIALCAEEGIGVIPWSPLARGRLTRPWSDTPPTRRAETDQFGKTLYRGYEDADRAIIEAVGRIAEARGVPRAQVALAWVLTRPAVTAPIIGASKMQHLEDAVAAASLKLTGEEIAALEAPYRARPVSGFV